YSTIPNNSIRSNFNCLILTRLSSKDIMMKNHQRHTIDYNDLYQKPAINYGPLHDCAVYMVNLLKRGEIKTIEIMGVGSYRIDNPRNQKDLEMFFRCLYESEYKEDISFPPYIDELMKA